MRPHPHGESRAGSRASIRTTYRHRGGQEGCGGRGGSTSGALLALPDASSTVAELGDTLDELEIEAERLDSVIIAAERDAHQIEMQEWHARCAHNCRPQLSAAKRCLRSTLCWGGAIALVLVSLALFLFELWLVSVSPYPPRAC